jgi:hypothetical protein
VIVKIPPASALLSSLALSSALLAQTTITYQAPTGSVSPSLVVTMNLTGGGTALLNPVVGPNCYLGTTCAFPNGYAGTYMTYRLPDGSTANLPNFNGTFSALGNNNYEISGQASGTDSQSRNISVGAVQVTMHITCRSGRGGGCSKVYTGGTLTITLNGMPLTSTPTATFTPTCTPTLPPCFGDCNGDHHVTVDEIMMLVNMALGDGAVSTCIAGDMSPDNQITIDQILTAVNNALQGCH